MNQDRYYIVLFSLLTLALLVIGVRGLAGRKPFMLPAWVHLAIGAGLLLPMCMLVVDTVMIGGPSSVRLMGLLCCAVLPTLYGIACWRQRGAILFYGITERPFRNAYRRALEDLGVAADEWPTKLAIPSRELTIKVQASAHSAVAVLTPNPRSKRQFLLELSRQIRRDYVDDGTLRERIPNFVNVAGLLAYVLFLLGLCIYL